MRFIINADDYGRSKGITDNISECFDKGCLTSVSIPVVGNSPEYAFEELKKRSKLRSVLHLDLIEGKPLSSRDEIPALVNKDGRFFMSFLTLWLEYFLTQDKESLKNQVKIELKAQIDKYINLLGGDRELNIDSHQHMHLVPFVFEALIELSSEYKFNYIRIVKEPFFISLDGESAIRSYLGPNLIKHFLLNKLCGKYAGILREKSIKYPDYFIGTLFTGYMTSNSIKSALKQIKNKDGKVEILIHACKAVKGEEHFWDHIPGLKRYYYSKFRDQEKEILLSDEFKKLVM